MSGLQFGPSIRIDCLNVLGFQILVQDLLKSLHRINHIPHEAVCARFVAIQLINV